MKNKKLNFSGAFAIIAAILVLVIFVPVNLIVGYYDKVFDMTPNKRYTFNDKTVELLDSVADKEIEVYYLSKLSYLQDAPEYLSLYHTLTQLDARDNISLTCFDPNEDAALAKELDPTGVLGTEDGDVFIKCGDTIKRIDHSKIFQTIDGVLNYAGEELIAGGIKICTQGSLPTIYFLTGHGEESVGPDMSEEELTAEYGSDANKMFPYAIFARQLRANNYDVQELDLDEAGAVPDNAAIICIAGPTEDITDKEKDLLCEFLDNGGSVAAYIAPCDTEGLFDNIEIVLAKYGIEMEYNIVTESEPALMLNDRNSVQSEYYFRVEYPAGANSGAELTQDLTTELNNGLEAGAWNNGISNTRSFTEFTTNNDRFTDMDNIEKSPIITNYLLGDDTYTTVSTPMGGDEDSADFASSLDGAPLSFGYYSYNLATGGKMVVFGTTDIINSNGVSVSVNGSTYLALFSTTWLYDTDIQMGIGNKLNSYDEMSFKDASEASGALAVIIIVPLLVAAAGVIVWLIRRHA